MNHRTTAPGPVRPASTAPTRGPLTFLVALALLLPLLASSAARARTDLDPSLSPLSPSAIAISPHTHATYVGCATRPGLVVLERLDPGPSANAGTFIALPLPATGLTLDREGRVLFVTCAGPRSEVIVLDAVTRRITRRFPAGHTAMAPVLSPDERTLFVCYRFENAVVALDSATGRETARIPVVREPVAAAVTPDGRHLLVANHLHNGRADVEDVAASVSVIDVSTHRVVKTLRLPNGSGALNDLRVSPDGRYAVVTHILARFHLPTTQLERGWMNTNAETIIDLASLELLNTVLLDAVDSGAANPWGVAWTPDGLTQVVAHAGTHEVSLIDFPALLSRLSRLPARIEPGGKGYEPIGASRVRADVPNDLSFLVGIRRRVRLPATDRGPRAITVDDSRVVMANYFSDSLAVLDAGSSNPVVATIPLLPGPRPTPDVVRRGEEAFNDATICFQGWQSCATCHPGDARVDALNWDLLNDDIGNPKNNKSLLLSHRTPPAMSLAVRDSAEVAVRAGIRHILFTVQPDSVASSMDAYLKALKPVPSPLLVKGHLSPEARRGRRIFENSKVGCATCHPADRLFTDQKPYDVGTRAVTDKPTDTFDTPTLIEIWRTAPYLHDGSVASLKELLTSRNPGDRHGRTSHLDPRQVDDLVAYLLSL